MLNLNDLLRVPYYERNKKVLELNKFILKSGITFSEEYGELHGGYREGILDDDSLEMLFNLNNIDIVERTNDSKYILVQYSEVYIVEMLIGKEGCKLPYEHLNFNNIDIWDMTELNKENLFSHTE